MYHSFAALSENERKKKNYKEIVKNLKRNEEKGEKNKTVLWGKSFLFMRLRMDLFATFRCLFMGKQGKAKSRQGKGKTNEDMKLYS